MSEDNPREQVTQVEFTPVYSQITGLEEPPGEDWFLEKLDENGRRVVFLRVKVTGMLPRIIGPFPSRKVAIWCLDELVNEIVTPLEEKLTELFDEHGTSRPYHNRFVRVIVEDPLLFGSGQPAAKNGRPAKRRKAA